MLLLAKVLVVLMTKKLIQHLLESTSTERMINSSDFD